MSKEKQNQRKILNRRARYDYEIQSQIEAGIVLNGSEVKSIRLGKVVLDNSYAVFKKGELWILNLYIDLKNLNKKLENIDRQLKTIAMQYNEQRMKQLKTIFTKIRNYEN